MFSAFRGSGPSMPGRISTFLPSGDLPCGYFDAASDKFRCRVLVGSFSSAKAVALKSFAICGGIPYQIERRNTGRERSPLSRSKRLG